MYIKLFLISLCFIWSYLKIEASEGLLICASKGGFKLQNFRGNIEADLKGSCLIHDFKGTISWKGKWTRIYMREGRSMYKGEGKVTIKGDAKVIQFLGCFINSKVSGEAKITLYPRLIENDKKNFYKYDKEKIARPWGIFSLDTLWLPKK